MSIIANTLANIPTAAYPIAAGLFANSGIFFGNLGLTLAGPLPIVKEELGASGLNPRQKLTVWRLFFDKAATLVVGGSVLAAALHLGALPLLPTSSLKWLAASSAVLSLSILPYTGYAVMPVIKQLKALDRQSSLSETDEKQVDRLIRKWDTLHKVRYGMYGPAWVVSLVTLVGVVSF